MVEIELIEEQNYSLIAIDGDIDASSSIHLDNAIEGALKSNHSAIIVDCHQLNYISSAGLGVFMSYLQELENSGTNLVLYGLNPKVKNTFEILGLDELLQIVENKEVALKQI